jgi:hypothetical protein
MLKNFTLILLFTLCATASPLWSQTKGGLSGTSDGKEKVVKLYPNPATSKVNFEIQRNNEKGYELIVYNFLGKKMDHFKNLQVKNELNLDSYYAGVYIFQLRDKVTGGLIESGKFNVVK